VQRHLDQGARQPVRVGPETFKARLVRLLALCPIVPLSPLSPCSISLFISGSFRPEVPCVIYLSGWTMRAESASYVAA
jgi:hypothetical protein